MSALTSTQRTAAIQAALFGDMPEKEIEEAPKRRKPKKSSTVEAFSTGEIQYRPYQEECIEAIMDAYDHGVMRQVESLSTGAGKTIMIGLLIKKFRERQIEEGKEPLKTLVIAHRKELVEQNAQKVKWVNPDLTVQIEQADLLSDSSADVISASIATIGREGSSRLKKFKPRDFGLVIVDEVHHAAASTYTRVLLDHFKTDHPDSHILVTGWSATVRRHDGKGLDKIFDEITYHKGVQDFIEEGWLCRLRGVRVSTDTDISEVGNVAGDFNQGELRDTINTPGRNEVLYQAWKKHALEGGRHSTLIFCVDRAHASSVQEVFQNHGVEAGLILGNTHRDERSETIEKFGKREIPVLINVGVMTEGTDVPAIDTIIMARPTQSSPLYIQIVGRGLRLYEGKEHCLVVDVVDICQTHSLMTVPVLFGLNEEFDPEGEDLVDTARRINEMAEDNGAVLNAVSIEDAEKIMSEDFDPFSVAQPPEEIQNMSEMKWFQAGEDRYRADIKGGDVKRGHIEVRNDGLDHWEVVHHRADGTETVIRRRNDVNLAFQAADSFIKSSYADAVALMGKTQSWHEHPPSEAQLRLLRKVGKWLPEGIPQNVTKGQAAELIDKSFKLMESAKKKNRNAKPPRKAVDHVKVGKI